jgi:hypothetical protein
MLFSILTFQQMTDQDLIEASNFIIHIFKFLNRIFKYFVIFPKFPDFDHNFIIRAFLWLDSRVFSFDLRKTFRAAFNKKWMAEYVAFPWDFVKVVHVELSDETREVFVLEVLRQDVIHETLKVDYFEGLALLSPSDCLLEFRVSQNFVNFYQKRIG